ncbi:MAG: integrin alpha [Candidatus Eisenbacteria bacterium]
MLERTGSVQGACSEIRGRELTGQAAPARPRGFPMAVFAPPKAFASLPVPASLRVLASLPALAMLLGLVLVQTVRAGCTEPSSPPPPPITWYGYYTMQGGVPHAVEGETWTFDHGAPDPLEGWTVVNFNRNVESHWSLPTVADFDERDALPAIPGLEGMAYGGRRVLWLGTHEDTADSLCWPGGGGYGSYWNQRITSPVLAGDPDSQDDVLLGLPIIHDMQDVGDVGDTLRVLVIANGVETEVAAFGGQELDGENKAYIWIGSAIGAAEEFQVAFEFRNFLLCDEDGGYDSKIGACRIDNVEVEGRGLHELFSFDGGPRDFPVSGYIPPVVGAQVGFSMTSCDVNGDGIDDLIAGAPFYSNGEVNEGAVYVFLVSANGTFVLDKVLELNRANSYFGASVAGLADVDGDGYDDVLVGLPSTLGQGQRCRWRLPLPRQAERDQLRTVVVCVEHTDQRSVGVRGRSGGRSEQRRLR